MDLRMLDIKKRTLNVLRDAGYKTIEELVLLSDEEILSIHGVTKREYDDLKECLYCVSCSRSYYHSSSCYQNVLHKGRFMGAGDGVECFDFGTVAVVSAERTHLFSAYEEYDAPVGDVSAERITLPLNREDVYCLSVTALYELCKELFEAGAIKPHNSSGVLIELLQQLEEALPEEAFSQALHRSHRQLCELLTEKSFGKMPVTVCIDGQDKDCLVEFTPSDKRVVFHLPKDVRCGLYDVVELMRDL